MRIQLISNKTHFYDAQGSRRTNDFGVGGIRDGTNAVTVMIREHRFGLVALFSS